MPLQDTPATVPAQKASLGAEAVERRAGVKIIRAGGGGAPESLVIDVAKALNTGLPAAPDPRLIEQTPHGPVPRIGADGARPSEVYARPAGSSSGMTHGTPRIALLIGGMGLAPRATETAIASLPGSVTLGFAPYGADLARETTRAREAGHEVVLQIPMESFDFPRDNPGPHTLLAGAGKAANIDNLTWLMSRFTGYAGVANFLGGKLTADAKALTPVLREIAARGLFYVDDGTSAQSLAMTLAPGQALAAVRADLVLDSTAEPEAIEAALARLEAIARDKGAAIGVASALPASVETIGRFARALEARGIALIPLSAAMPSQQSGLAIGSSTVR
ncbi:MAG TPA: divergent polysaccharide deacetylase family protein [Methylocella sp.]|nr:divergent polysaccharide deacetylase family protein [Methylocella sp.]